MTQHDLISTLRTLCRTHVERENGILALVYGDLLIELPTIIAPYRDNGDEFFVGIRPFGFECCSSELSLREKSALFTKQTIVAYCIKVTRFDNGSLSYDITHTTTYVNR